MGYVQPEVGEVQRVLWLLGAVLGEEYVCMGCAGEGAQLPSALVRGWAEGAGSAS